MINSMIKMLKHIQYKLQNSVVFFKTSFKLIFFFFFKSVPKKSPKKIQIQMNQSEKERTAICNKPSNADIA